MRNLDPETDWCPAGPHVPTSLAEATWADKLSPPGLVFSVSPILWVLFPLPVRREAGVKSTSREGLGFRGFRWAGSACRL